MSFLLDTNVVSEWVKPQPNPGVVAWLSEADEDAVFISVMTLAELRYGIERMPAGNRRKRLDDWLSNALPIRFEDRILPIDVATADTWGKLMARRQAAGRPMSVADAFIAATVEVHGLTLVTRNAADFEPTLKEIINPWA
jgi:predicted nucleic acid-binding protein